MVHRLFTGNTYADPGARPVIIAFNALQKLGAHGGVRIPADLLQQLDPLEAQPPRLCHIGV